MDKSNYLEILSEQIRCKNALPLVLKEIEDHIDDQKQQFVADGMEPGEAEAAAVREMGDPVQVGGDMDRIHRPKMNWKMIQGIAALSVFGFVLLYILDGLDPYGTPVVKDHPLKYLFIMGAGLMLMIAVCYVDYTKVLRRAREIMLVYSIGLIAGMAVAPVQINGFFYIGVWVGYINIRMAALLLIPLYGAVLYSYKNQGYKGIFKGILWGLSSCMILLTVTGSAAYVFQYVLAYAVILTTAVCKGRLKVSKVRVLAGIWGSIAAGILAGAMYFQYFGAQYQKDRLKMILHPGAYASGEAYPFTVFRELLAECRWIGESHAIGKISEAIPEKIDFSLAYIAAYAGIFAAVLTMGAILLLLIKALCSVLKQKNYLGMLTGVSCVTVLFVQIGYYILLNTGIMIGGEAYCPFITYGGSGMIVTYILLGLVLSIYRYENVTKDPKTVRFFQRIKS